MKKFAIALAAVVLLGLAVPTLAQDNKATPPAAKKDAMPAEKMDTMPAEKMGHHHRHHHHHHHQMMKPEPKPQ
jgi:ABC-type nickel/cobalt efflux system permease component RcnA